MTIQQTQAFEKSVRAMQRRINRMGHLMIWDIQPVKVVRKLPWSENPFQPTLRATGQCVECGGTASARLYVDGEHDCGGEVLAMECPEAS